MCKLCNDTGKMGSSGYWVYCSCKEGRKKWIESKSRGDRFVLEKSKLGGDDLK